MALKVFEGFQLEMVSELSLLSASSINTLRRHGMVTPVKQSGGYLYSFADVLTLRVIRQLRENDVPLKNIVKAHDYLSKLNTSKSLFNLGNSCTQRHWRSGCCRREFSKSLETWSIAN
ncbi:MAG: MerR family transcriptional regulator [Candidatus Obscuribacter sp.]|nr:MerR family transcriptional regulator [Candidatus Obscuribacter sp.]